MIPSFGTDGVRGIANTEFTAELALALARASAQVLARGDDRPQFLVARDTRASGDMLEAAVAAGLCSGGADAVICGVMPTPALACLVPTAGAAGGVMVSASHNPYQYNGLKFLDRAGNKISVAEEASIESLACAPPREASRACVGRAHRREGLVAAYRDRLLSFAPSRMSHDMRVVVDCAHGALSELAPGVLAEIGATVIALNCSPTGTNINDGGAVKPQRLVEVVREQGADAGLAFDGDGDRLVVADEQGALIDGDQLLAIWARDLARRGELANGLVVGTVIANGGLEEFLASLGCRLHRTPVGDRHVAAAMRRTGAVLGGETCGHIIYGPHLSNSDGLLTAIAILSIAARTGRPLSALAAAMRKRPQVSLNLPVAAGGDWLDHPEVRLAVGQAEAALEKRGRVIVRPSGTEPVVRITCESDDEGQARAIAEGLAGVIEQCAKGRERIHADIAA